MKLIRETRETSVTVQLGGSNAEAKPEVQTGDTFLDHMIVTLARYSGLPIMVQATGDMRHHLVEDVAITLGQVLRDRIPDACRRYGHSVVPMDDALVEATLDVGGRVYYEGRLPSALYEHFLRSLAENAGMTLHVRVLRGRDRHHIVEAAIKATGFALQQALLESEGVFSTKGAVRIERIAD